MEIASYHWRPLNCSSANEPNDRKSKNEKRLDKPPQQQNPVQTQVQHPTNLEIHPKTQSPFPPPVTTAPLSIVSQENPATPSHKSKPSPGNQPKTLPRTRQRTQTMAKSPKPAANTRRSSSKPTPRSEVHETETRKHVDRTVEGKEDPKPDSNSQKKKEL